MYFRQDTWGGSHVVCCSNFLECDLCAVIFVTCAFILF